MPCITPAKLNPTLSIRLTPLSLPPTLSQSEIEILPRALELLRPDSRLADPRLTTQRPLTTYLRHHKPLPRPPPILLAVANLKGIVLEFDQVAEPATCGAHAGDDLLAATRGAGLSEQLLCLGADFAHPAFYRAADFLKVDVATGGCDDAGAGAARAVCVE